MPGCTQEGKGMRTGLRGVLGCVSHTQVGSGARLGARGSHSGCAGRAWVLTRRRGPGMGVHTTTSPSADSLVASAT